MIAPVRPILATLLLGLLPLSASAQCAPAPDSAYFFRNLSEQRAEARIAGNRNTFDHLLSADFVASRPDATPLDKRAFIEAELAAGAPERRRFFSIRDYKLVEHRKGFAVTNYRLIEGSTGGGDTQAVERWQRETYEVQDGQWRLKSVETSPVEEEASGASPFASK